jgi:hypothetical protein
MVRARAVLSKAFLFAALAVLIAFLAVSYQGLRMPAQLDAMYIAKVLLGVLAALFLLAYQLKWILTRHDLPLLRYYAKKKMFEQNIAEGAGIVFLTSAFFLDMAQHLGWVQGTSATVITNVLEVIALVFFGYSYYRLMRFEGA